MSIALKTLAADTVRIEMIRRCWSGDDIARRAGLSQRSFETQLSGSFPNIAARAKIEMALDYSVPIWSSINDLAARKFCRDRFGGDPALLPLPELRQLAARVRLPGWQAHALKADLLAALLTHVTALEARDAANAKPTTPAYQNAQPTTTKIK